MFRCLARFGGLLLGIGLLHGPPARAQARDMVLATTTSTQDSGLLDSLLPVFRGESGIEVKVIAVGSGAALAMARTGDADAVLVHAPEAERPYVESGDLVEGRRIMHNDFLVVGPKHDPAGAGGAGDLAGAMRKIAAAGPFISRGDGSGTEQKERELWKAAGVEPAQVHRREETGQGMGATLLVASERGGYTLTDRGTYLALRERLDLVPLAEGDSKLLNVYHAYVVNPARHRKVKPGEARAFVAFLASEPAQALIGSFGESRFGQPLFFPDAGKGLP
jgi:tungstate transport system substrate-binding protein